MIDRSGDDMKVNVDDFEFAMEFVSCDHFDSEAYIDAESGTVYCSGEGIDDPLPNDIYENKKYLEIPTKHDLELGKPLVLRFTALEMPNQVDSVYSIFKKRGAYANFKALLDTLNLTEKWYDFEKSATQQAILEWVDEQSVTEH